MILGRRNPLYTLLLISPHLLSNIVKSNAQWRIRRVNDIGTMTYLNPSLAILYEPSPHLVVVVADDVDFQMGNPAGRNSQIALRLVEGRGGVGRCSEG
jgi:hypothetical protein